MSPINSLPTAGVISLQVSTPTASIESEKTAIPAKEPNSPPEKKLVVISAEGKEKLSKEQQRNADIDATHLPEGIKKYLKSIRELQEKIKEKLAELQTAVSDRSLSDKERESKISKIQIELYSLSSTLTSVTNDLHQKEVALRLQSPDLKLINSLMSPR